jgi:Cu/Ag efflux protein CusF
MAPRSRLSRTLLVAATAIGFAASASTAVAAPSDSALQNRSDNAPGGAVTKVDENRPAGAGTGRKIG